ncbi:pyridoxal-phosphate dependent enzyme [Geodermatophilus sp. CPCC 205761]|uniref:pyridoxal-phosphate dependent enzyme n=1 Tax=Geodermatophilus sp. CPCC 205761 TaxID=2936597 RepID=UPI003EEEF8E8
MRHLGILESNLSGSGFEGLRISKALGCHVTFFTRDVQRYLDVPGAPAYFDDYVDEIVHCETNVLEELLPHVRAIAAQRPFDGFLTLAEYDVVVGAQVAVELGLPTVSVEGVRVARNKALMRRRCAEAGLPMPAFRTVETPAQAREAALGVGLPCVVKPADETSSADVRRCLTPDEAAGHVALIRTRVENTRGQARYHELMVEECVRGPEVSVEVLAEGDRFEVLGVTDKSLAGHGYFVEIGHSFPSALPPETVRACGELATDALRAVGFDLGMAHVEIRVTESGPRLIEINPRPAGGKITDLVDHALGICCLELAIRQYLGQSLPDVVLPPAPVAGAAIRYLSGPPGRVVAVTGQERAAGMPGVLEVTLKPKPGDVLRPLHRNGDRAGHVLVVAETAALASRTAEAAGHEIGIHTEPLATGPAGTSIADLVGRTPLVELDLQRLLDAEPGGARVLAKLEMLNPLSSSKDRAALSMLAGAEARGELAPGGTVVEATSGNTGISLAALAAARGHRCIIVLPDNATPERLHILRALGAEVVRTPAEGRYEAAVAKAEEIHRATPGSWFCRQHENPDNVRAHLQTTGPEIWAATGGELDVLVCGVGTGGTLSGIARYVKQRRPGVRVVAVEPAGSPLLSGGVPGPHGIPGFNGGFIAATTDRDLIDEVVTVTDADALATAHRLARRAGLLVGVSAGAAVHASGIVAARAGLAGAVVVTVLPDTGERYLSAWHREAESAVPVAVAPEPVIVSGGVP